MFICLCMGTANILLVVEYMFLGLVISPKRYNIDLWLLLVTGQHRSTVSY